MTQASPRPTASRPPPRNGKKRRRRVFVYAADRLLDTSSDALLTEIKRVGRLVKGNYTQRKFLRHSTVASNTLRRRFGSWFGALKLAGLDRRAASLWAHQAITWEDCYRNLATLWRHCRRAPRNTDANHPPSKISSNVYIRRFGSWRETLRAFIGRANGNLKAWPKDVVPTALSFDVARRKADAAVKAPGDKGNIPPIMRLAVLRRDRHRCVICHASPATQRHCVLHIDHLIPRAKGGPTALPNLRVLCGSCNGKKGAR